MKNITKTNKYIPVFILAFGLILLAKPAFATQCWTNSGPAWMNCNAQDGNDNDNNDDNDDNDSDNLNVSTLSASNVDEDSATLRGDITDLDESEDYERYFEWGTDEDDLDHTATLSGTTDDEGSFSKTISGLSDDREYFYRACAEEDNGGDDDCGSVRSFTTDEDGGSSNDNDNDNDNANDDSDGEGSVLTTDASSVTATSAILNAVVTNDSGSQTVWFEWGPTVNLGNRTANRVISAHQSIVSAQLYGLAPGHAYFFRVISSSGDEGDYRAFVTSSTNTVSSGGSNTNNNQSNSNSNSNSNDDEDEDNNNESSNDDDEEDEEENSGPDIMETVQYFNLSVVASSKDVAPGSTISMAVVYENLHNETLRNIVIAVDFPGGLTPTDIGNATKISDRQLEIKIPAMAPLSKANITIEAEVYEKLANDTFLVTVAEATYDHPLQANTRIESVNSSIIKVSSNVAVSGSTKGNQSANAGGSGASFFPKSIVGWLVLVGGITLIIFLAGKISKKKADKKVQLKVAR